MKRFSTVIAAMFCCFFLASFSLSAQYCNGGPSSTADSNVEAVALAGAPNSINHTGCPGVTGSEDLTAQSADLVAGVVNSLSVTFGTCGGNYSGAGEVWIDYNQNGTFDASESIGQSSGTPGTAPWDAPVVFSFTVPVSAFNGTTVMRVMQREGGSNPLDPCGTYSWGSSMDFSINITGGTVGCIAPNTLTASNVTGSSADLGWTSGGSGETAWDVEVVDVTAGGTQTMTATASGVGNPYTASGLSPENDYEFYVRAACSGGSSDWSGPFAFTTGCAPGANQVIMNMIDSFGDGWNGATYTITDVNTGTAVGTGTLASGGAGSDTYCLPDGCYLVDVTGGSYPGEVSWDLTDGAGTSIVSGGAPVTSANFSLGAGVCPSCTDPTDFAGAVSTVSWTPGGACVTGAVLEYGAFGFVPGTGATAGGGTVMSVACGTASQDLAGVITAGMCVDVYLREDCGGGDVSNNVGPVQVCNLSYAPTCGAGALGAQYGEEFDAGVGTWSNVNVADPQWVNSTGGTGSTGTGPSAPGSGAGYLFLETSGGAEGDADVLTSPVYDLSIAPAGEPIQLSFLYHMYGDGMGTLKAEVTTDGATWTKIFAQSGQIQTANADAWTAASLDISAYQGAANFQIRFNGIRGAGFTSDMAVDAVSINICQNCPAPTALAAANITGETADLSWTESGSATVWNIEIVDVTGGGTQTMTATASGVSNPYAASGLTPENDYEFYVQADCGGSTSDWAGPFAFTTGCAAGTNTIVMNMIDSFGDGWNGATYTITDANSGTVIGTGTLASGGAGADTYCVADGCYNVDVTGGTYPGEVSWDLTDGAGTSIVSGAAPETSANFSLGAGVCPTCLDPTALAAGNITETTADLSWTAGNTETAWNIEIVDITAGNTQTMTATASGVGNPYTATGLTGENDYEYYVQADCGSGETSAWVGPFAFTTGCLATNNTVVMNMIDSFGDGWNGATYTITDVNTGTVVGTGTLAAGAAGADTYCLPDGCYNVDVTGGSFASEVSWDLTDGAGTTIVSGGAPTTSANFILGVADCCGPNAVTLPPAGTAASFTATTNCDDDAAGDAWTYYENPNQANEYLFAIQWAPDATLHGTNAAAKAAAMVTIDVMTAQHVAENGTTEASYGMARYWNVELGGLTFDEPVNVKFFYDPVEKTDVETSSATYATNNGVGDNGFMWFKTPSGAYSPAGTITSADFQNSVLLLNEAGSGTENGVTYVQFDGLTSFSGGSGASGAGAGFLPIELASFSGQAMDNYNLLEWTTASEENTRMHVIERSLNGTADFREIGSVEAAGNSQSDIRYALNDEKPGILSYYRLKTIDLDGAVQYSNVISIQRKGDIFDVVNTYPVPTSKDVTIEFVTAQDEEVVYTVTDVTGKVIMHNVIDAEKGLNKQVIDMANMSNGVYFLTLQNSTSRVIKNIVKN